MCNKVFEWSLFQLIGVIIEEQLVFFTSAAMCHMFPDNRQFDYNKPRSKIRLQAFHNILDHFKPLFKFIINNRRFIVILRGLLSIHLPFRDKQHIFRCIYEFSRILHIIIASHRPKRSCQRKIHLWIKSGWQFYHILCASDNREREL